MASCLTGSRGCITEILRNDNRIELWLVIIIIILNTTACVAVIEMIRFLSVYSYIEDNDTSHFLSTPGST